MPSVNTTSDIFKSKASPVLEDVKEGALPAALTSSGACATVTEIIRLER